MLLNINLYCKLELKKSIGVVFTRDSMHSFTNMFSAFLDRRFSLGLLEQY